MKRGPFDEAPSLPSSGEIERKVLACAVYAPDWYDGLDVRRDDFFFEAHRKIHDALETLRSRGERKDISFPNVRLFLNQARVENDWEPHAWQRVEDALAVVMDTRGKPTEMECAKLREFALCRQVAQATSAVNAAVSMGDLAKVREALDAASDAADAESLEHTYTMHELAKMAYEDVVSRRESDDASEGADLGLTHLRYEVGRLGPGVMMVIGARPNVGKSGKALAMAEGGIPHGTRPGYISLEDATKIVGPRGLALKAGISPRNMQNEAGFIDMAALWRGVELWEGQPFFVEFPKKKDHVSVKQAMRRLARRGVNLVFIDYLQVIRFAEKGIERREAVGYILSEIKAVGDECGQGIVIFSQLRRRTGDEKRSKRVKGKENKRPDLDELKEAGDIEEKADIVELMWREDNFDDAVVNVEIAKSKWGGVGYEYQMKRSEDGVLREVKPHEKATQSRFSF